MEISVAVARLDLHTGPKQWLTEPMETAEGVIAARTLRRCSEHNYARRQSVGPTLRLSRRPASGTSIASAGMQSARSSTAATCAVSPLVDKNAVAGLTSGNDLEARLQDVNSNLLNELVAKWRTLTAIFSKNEYDFGLMGRVECAIDIVGSFPIRHVLEKHQLHTCHMPLTDEYVQQLQDYGMVNPNAGSEWVSNILLIRGKDGGIQYGLDYRSIGSATPEGPRVEKPSFLPTVQQTVNENCSVCHDKARQANAQLAGITDSLAEESLSIASPCMQYKTDCCNC